MRSGKKSREVEGQQQPPKWVPLIHDELFSKEDQFFVDVRRLQQRTSCTDATCQDIIQTFSNYLGINLPSDFKSADKKMHQKAGARVLRLNGCVGCHRKVYMPDDRAKVCPLRKEDGTICGHPRYDGKGKPYEVSCMNQ